MQFGNNTNTTETKCYQQPFQRIATAQTLSAYA
jgi:hypothetical protein